VQTEARCFGKVSLDSTISERELQYLDEASGYGGYERFSGRNGRWSAIMLRNRDGDARDERSHEHESLAKPTEHWHHLPCLARLLDDHFDLNLVSNVRVMQAVAGGMILAHRDYKEHLGGGFNRLHVPIRTSPYAVSAEGSTVYHQRHLECWLVEGREVHSALNAGPSTRHHLTLDFPISIALERVFRKSLVKVDSVAVLNRTPLPDTWKQFIEVIGFAMRQDTVEFVATALNRLAFIYEMDFASVYDHLVQAAEFSVDPECVRLAAELRTYMLFARQE
jgi:hypothetical protein